MTYSFISKAFEKDEGICRETFFSKDMPSAVVRKCARRIALLGRASPELWQRPKHATVCAGPG